MVVESMQRGRHWNTARSTANLRRLGNGNSVSRIHLATGQCPTPLPN
jgi:hypothetical protein